MFSPAARDRRKFVATVPPQEILPVVDENFESTVRGIYVIGDATGTPLVKVAANQGAALLRAMEQQGRFEASRKREGLDLVIIGAGPAGLSAAVEAKARGLRFVVLERARAASTVRGFPAGKKVYAEPRHLLDTSALGTGEDLDRDNFVARMQGLIAEKDLPVKEGVEVTRVRRRADDRFEVATDSGPVLDAANVVVAVGRQGRPRALEVPGAELTHKVVYRAHTAEDCRDKRVLVVGGGNSAVETALMLAEHNRVTLSYRGEAFFRTSSGNRAALEAAEREGRLTVLRGSVVTAIFESEVALEVAGEPRVVPNDLVIVQIGVSPPVDFLLDMGLELDGVWTPRRFVYAGAGLLVGIFIYFFAQHFALSPEKAGPGYWYVPWARALAVGPLPGVLNFLLGFALPVGWLLLLALHLLNWNLKSRHRQPLLHVPGSAALLGLGAMLYGAWRGAPHVFTLHASEGGPGPYLIPGFDWLYAAVPVYFGNLYGFYYLLYFLAIAVFGLYWAWRANHRRIWIRNLTIIVTQWTLWWGIPTLLVVLIGRNPWTPLIGRSLNAWPLKMNAFEVEASAPGDPAWWHTVAVAGVVWAAILTFIVIPLVTIRWGKIYCSYICSCGALAETVGHSFRHRGPKGDFPRWLERLGFVVVALAALATIAQVLGHRALYDLYNVWIGTFLSGAVAIGLYPFLGQRLWCRLWCPLAFWMNFWGRWSVFKISPEKGKCIDCNICNQFCQMGIDIKSRALRGEPVTLKDTPCVACAECVVRCPMEILHIGDAPER